ncbi:MAG TPA: tRNA (guanosine(37)-N1)-methyltransferase TrmD [Myxococcaceae bacterium]|nr:tRNA (guanosine(37)-N1)-methyltransferase TrmD [Myxococcaceae bacterium]
MDAFEILTLVPPAVQSYLSASVLGKAAARGAIRVTVTDVRDFASGKHKVTDDVPYGGGPGMVMKVEPLAKAIAAARERAGGSAHVLLTSPRGRRWEQPYARELADRPGTLVLVCGRYEGVDERVLRYVDGQVSLGDFVLTGGELAAMAVVDSVARLLPGVLGNDASTAAESFQQSLLEYPQYTRPPEFDGQAVPEILLSGDHAKIARWRRFRSLELTRQLRPDIWQGVSLDVKEKEWLDLDATVARLSDL